MISESPTQLLEKLNSYQQEERAIAIRQLTNLKNENIGFYLLTRLKCEKSIFIKELLVECLAKIFDNQLYKNIFDLFEMEDAYLRNAAIKIFSSGNNELIEFLNNSFNSSNDDVKKLVLDSLFEIGTPQAILVLRKGLNDSNINIRITSIEYLSRLGDTENIETFINILKSENEPMIIMAILDSLNLVADEESINKIIEIILPDRNLNLLQNINDAFLSVILEVLGKTVSREEFLSIIDFIPSIESFYCDIIKYLQTGVTRFKEILNENKVKELICNILLYQELDDKNTYDILDLLSKNENEKLNLKIDTFMNEWIINTPEFRQEIVDLFRS